ncbi:helix-turn-helix domain-containing protein [Acinetobacter higginsii]|uniref:helix-turn-helix domain-containing protein n=1 Tax=Acinetobacter higginsii TaxID=70347 RepID=UPI001F60F8D8|nr:helix-turn-helix transcriptional regulator [Acinetobacter higginsii]MCI3877704.1 helix-turn-helix domain-containing protein [Acinetobacter higginsii]
MNKISFLDNEYNLDTSIIKKEQIAASLVGLMKHKGLNRVGLATALGWNKSRVSRLLSGDENLTVKTLTNVVHKLGYDFELVYFNKNYERPKQPWHIDRERKNICTVYSQQSDNIDFARHLVIQSREEVAKDLMCGRGKLRYVSLHEDYISFIEEHAPPISSISFETTASIRFSFQSSELEEAAL